MSDEEEFTDEDVEILGEMANEISKRMIDAALDYCAETGLDPEDPSTKDFLIEVLRAMIAGLCMPPDDLPPPPTARA